MNNCALRLVLQTLALVLGASLLSQDLREAVRIAGRN